MKKYMLGLAALLLMVTMGSAALAGAGDQVDRLCPTCGVTTTGTVDEVTSWTSSQHQFTFKCGTCQSTSQFDEAHCGDSLATCTTAGTCTICDHCGHLHDLRAVLHRPDQPSGRENHRWRRGTE